MEKHCDLVFICSGESVDKRHGDMGWVWRKRCVFYGSRRDPSLLFICSGGEGGLYNS